MDSLTERLYNPSDLGTRTPSDDEIDEVTIEELDELIAKFNGKKRREYSNQIASDLYVDNKEAVVDALIDGILPDGKWSYRVNLYIFRTLSLIKPNWEGTDSQLEKLKNLRKMADYKDKTYKKLLENAISNYQLR